MNPFQTTLVSILFEGFEHRIIHLSYNNNHDNDDNDDDDSNNNDSNDNDLILIVLNIPRTTNHHL